MVFNSDWLLNQIRGTENTIGKVFKLESIKIDLGMVEDKEGKAVNGNDYLDFLLAKEDFDRAVAVIGGQLKRLSPHQYKFLVDTFIDHLKTLDAESLERNHLTLDKIEKLHEDLKEFKW